MVSSSQLLVVNADPGPFASGEWDQQSVPAGGAGFTQASLDGNMVLYLSGLSLAGTANHRLHGDGQRRWDQFHGHHVL